MLVKTYLTRQPLMNLIIDNKDRYCYKKVIGAVAQMGEYLTGSQGVGGSIPLSSTIF